MNAPELHRRLLTLVGTRFAYLDCEWELIDVLVAEDRVVIESVGPGSNRRIQDDQYGRACRKAAQTLSLAISDSSGDGYSTDLLVLLEGRIGAARD